MSPEVRIDPDDPLAVSKKMTNFAEAKNTHSMLAFSTVKMYHFLRCMGALLLIGCTIDRATLILYKKN